MPFKRGSATMTMILLGNLAQRTGLKLGSPKEMMVLDLEALMRNEKDFTTAFKAGMFFEPTAVWRQ